MMPTAFGSPGDGPRSQSELGGELEGEDDGDNLQHMSSFKYAMSRKLASRKSSIKGQAGQA
jgi:hypothetical protein